MSKMTGVVVALVAGGIGYVLGLNHADTMATKTRAADTSAEAQSATDSARQNSKDTTPTANIQQPDAQQADANAALNEADTLIAKHPFHFQGLYEELARGNSYYGQIVERFENENGISSWGVSREGSINDLMQSAPLKEIQVQYLECRIKICLMRGVAESQKIAQRVYDNYSTIQQWGYHFNGRHDEFGNYHFYMITHRQDD